MKKTFIAAIAIFLLYNGFLLLTDRIIDRKLLAPSNLFQTNVIAGQSYIYDKRDSDVVIVGSSLANRLAVLGLPEKCFNLSLIGYSPRDGLEIIKRSGARPKVILIETNIIDRERTAVFTDALFLPWMYTLKRYLPALREENQPVNIIRAAGTQALRQLKHYYRRLAKKPEAGISQSEVIALDNDTPEMRRRIMDLELPINIKGHSKTPDEAHLDAMTAELKQYIQFFEGRNVQIIFFEMPEAQIFYDSNRMRALRAALSKGFPRENYRYLTSSNWSDYTTTDGVHLDPVSRDKYTAWLTTQLSRYLHKEGRPENY